MTKLASFELVAGTDVKAKEKTTVASLFPMPERSKEYQLLKTQKREPRYR